MRERRSASADVVASDGRQQQMGIRDGEEAALGSRAGAAGAAASSGLGLASVALERFWSKMICQVMAASSSGASGQGQGQGQGRGRGGVKQAAAAAAAALAATAGAAKGGAEGAEAEGQSSEKTLRGAKLSWLWGCAAKQTATTQDQESRVRSQESSQESRVTSQESQESGGVTSSVACFCADPVSQYQRLWPPA